jgi:type I restriction-modification system DNA methylase subunit
MSEELIQRGLIEHGRPFGPYELYIIGQTSLNELARYQIIKSRDYGEYGNYKPDVILVDRRNRDDIRTILVIEHKSRGEFNTEKAKECAIIQCKEQYCKPLDSHIGIATDGETYIWFNPKIENDNLEYIYILKEDGYPLKTPFEYDQLLQIQQSLSLINKLLKTINDTNSRIVAQKLLNPTQLAENVWQDVWITGAGDNPAGCLATFVEIFLFKYLSDLGLLKMDSAGTEISFDKVFSVGRDNCLKYYFKHVRNHIKTLFPPSTYDGTSVINGIVLKPDVAEHNIVFYEILNEFKGFGLLTPLDPEFKSRIYETFLKESPSKKNWGQFFTPRNVVKAIIQMSNIDSLPENSKVHDPACGVGGFILEPLLQSNQRDIAVGEKEINRRLIYSGYDRDLKTAILAKANMLIHLSHLLVDNPALANQFADLINSTFRSCHKSILGSLNDTPNEKFDLIMTNPPFAVTGSPLLKKHIHNNGNLNDFYNIPSSGIEGLFIQQIVKSLKEERFAFVIVPDGVMNRTTDIDLRRFIRTECILHAIISLPHRTFYTTSKKTYILVIQKRCRTKTIIQHQKIFAYLVANTGETLDAKRFPCENDLPKMVRLYKIFMAVPDTFETNDPQCKLIDLVDLAPEKHWSVDRLWSRQERLSLGLIEEAPSYTPEEYQSIVQEKLTAMQEIAQELQRITTLPNHEQIITTSLSNDNYFRRSIGKRVLLKELREMPKEASIPIYSANVKEPWGYVVKSNIEDFSHDSFLWGIDGNFEFNVIRAGNPFATTDHCGRLEIIHPLIDASYVRYQLEQSKKELDRSLRASLGRMGELSIEIPAKLDKEENLVPDIEMQQQIAELYDQLQAYKHQIEEDLQELTACEFTI